MYQALYRKYRPQNLDDVVGQDVITQTLKNSIKSQKISHAYIFTGPRGSGKTSVAKILAKTVNCKSLDGYQICNKCVCCTQKQSENMDIIEIDAASNNGVDEIREINNKVNLVPTLGKYKIYIIDEVHMLTIGAFNALLKTLEEPPSHIIFILATTDPQKVPITILSRCQRFDFKKISEDKMKERIKYIVDNEKLLIDESAILEIVRISDGSMRDALGILDQAISYTSGKISVEDIHSINGTITQKELINLIEYLFNGDISNLLNKIDDYNSNGKNISKITEEIIFLLRNIILYKSAPNYLENVDEAIKNISNKESLENLMQYISIFNESLLNMKKSFSSKIILEMAFIKIYSSIGKIENKKEENKNEPILNIENEPILNIENEPIIKPKINEKLNESKIKISQEIKNIDIADKNFEQFKKTRIENILARFSKVRTNDLKKQIKDLNDYLLDDKIGQYIEMILDGTIKAASEEGIIFAFKVKSLSDLFNENIIVIEKILKKIFKKEYLVIATDDDDWEIIKDDFNLKKVQYIYKKETMDYEQILKNKEQNTNNLNSLFGELLEYK